MGLKRNKKKVLNLKGVTRNKSNKKVVKTTNKVDKKIEPKVEETKKPKKTESK